MIEPFLLIICSILVIIVIQLYQLNNLLKITKTGSIEIVVERKDEE